MLRFGEVVTSGERHSEGHDHSDERQVNGDGHLPSNHGDSDSGTRDSAGGEGGVEPGHDRSAE